MLKYFCVTLLFVTDVLCKPDYLFNHEVDGWLKLHPVPATWQDAFFNCHYEGAVLASPINRKFLSALHETMCQSKLNAPIFIGVNALAPGEYTSVEGVPLANLSICWGNYVSNITSGCLSLSNRGPTFISSCSEMRPYICYKKRDNTTVLNQCGTFDDEYRLNQATGSCYKYHKKPTSWWVAHKICVAEGGDLVSIDNKQEADIVTSFMYNPKKTMSWTDAAYIGLVDRGKDHSFFTLTGKKIEDAYHIWAPGQPDNKGVNLCGLIYPEGTLDDVNCSGSSMKFICEKDPKTTRFQNTSGEVTEASSDPCDDETLP